MKGEVQTASHHSSPLHRQPGALIEPTILVSVRRGTESTHPLRLGLAGKLPLNLCEPWQISFFFFFLFGLSEAQQQLCLMDCCDCYSVASSSRLVACSEMLLSRKPVIFEFLLPSYCLQPVGPFWPLTVKISVDQQQFLKQSDLQPIWHQQPCSPPSEFPQSLKPLIS